MTSAVIWRIGDDLDYWDIPLVMSASPEATVTQADDLTGVDPAKITLYFRKAGSILDVAGTGTLSVKTAFPAEILYKPSVADVAATFVGSLVIKGLFPPSNSMADQAVYDPIPFEIIP